MADFDKAFDFMIGNEDYPSTSSRFGKVITDNDGGLVRFGVNSNSRGKELLQSNSTFYTTMPNDEALTLAKTLYRENEWVAIHGNEITSQPVASKILDMAVNQGIGQASKLAQRAASVNADGHIGPLTVAAINSMSEADMLTGLVKGWEWLIQQIVSNKPATAILADAWKVRADKIPV